MLTDKADETVQVPAPDEEKTPLPEHNLVEPEPPKPFVATVEPGVNYDKHRGRGGDYIVDDQGHRVPLTK